MRCVAGLAALSVLAATNRTITQSPVTAAQPVASRPTAARTPGGAYIGWREHVVDDASTGGDELQGGDGLVMADLDRDGYPDIVSVHESDSEYDNNPDGLIRIAFGSRDPDTWVTVTLASGKEAAAPEDVAVADLNGDGYLDVIGACELAHLIYFQNPGRDARTAKWPRLIPPAASNRGSFIRVFFADLNRDGHPEVVTANKGAQAPTVTQAPTPMSWFEVNGNPLDGRGWIEHELARVVWPINAQPVDLDGDGDLDVIGGSVAERRMLFFENRGGPGPAFQTHAMHITGTSLAGPERPPAKRNDRDPLVSGFNMEFVDLNGDGRLDIVTFEFARIVGRSVVWLEQPATPDGEWMLHEIGHYAPDEVVGLAVADIDGDGRPDVMTGGYSGGARNADADLNVNVAAGRLAWFRNPGPTGGSPWPRYDISRRRRGMFDKFVARDMDGDGDVDFATTRGNSTTFDGVFWLEQVRSATPIPSFRRAREQDSPELALP